MSNQECRYCGFSSKDQYRAELYDEVWQKARDMGYGNVTDALVALERMKATQLAAGEPVYQLRNPKIGPEWHEVDRVAYDEFSRMPAYQRRTLWTAPPAAAHGDEAVPNLVPGLQWAIDYCNAMLRQGNDRMLVEVIRARLENVRDIQPAAMRAQAGEGGEV